MNPVLTEIKENRQEAPGIFRLVLEPRQETAKARAGQFFMIKTAKGHDPLLRRPLGLLKTEPLQDGPDRLCFLYQVRGRGTRLLAGFQPGNETDLIGPLGSGWRLDENPSRIVMVAGGMGIVPLYAALAELAGRENPGRIDLVYGAATAAEIVLLKELEALAGSIAVCTEDGCLGEKGLAPDLFRKALEGGPDKPLVLACGPRPMLKKVRDICVEDKLACQVSMEARMGCGMGACLTCTAPGSAGTNLRVCKEGPVFDAAEIDWEALE